MSNVPTNRTGAALNERALGSLLPDHLQKPTYQGLGKPGARRYAGA